MAVLSIALLSKSGKVLLARQYLEMSRIRIEGILAAFPKLIDGGSSGGSGKQHTYVETGSIRYVYQPIEGLYLVLVTTRGSNIVQDLDTLTLLSKVVPEYSPVTEEDVTKNVFELIFAFDEVITLGYKENVTMEGIRTNLEMDSHNEKLHLMVQQSKMNEAKDEMRRKAAAIKASKAANPMGNRMQGMGNTPSLGGGGGGSSLGFGPGSSSSSSSSSSLSAGGAGSGSGSGSGGADVPASTSVYGSSAGGASSVPSKSGLKLGKGLKLGNKGGKGLSVMQQMAKEEGIDANALVQQQSSVAQVSAPGAVVRIDPVEVRVNETLTVEYDQDGALRKVEVRGVIQLLCHEEGAKLALELEHLADTSAFTFQPHPNLSKPDFLANKVLQMKNPDKAFAKDNALGMLKWRYAATEDETMVPLKVTCWPEGNGDGTTTVNMELELLAEHLALTNVLVCIPLASAEEPEVTNLEGGVHRHNARRHVLEWEHSVIDADNKTAQLEFIMPSTADEDLFPVTVSFASENTICPIHVAQVTDVATGEPAKFGYYRQLTVDRFEIVANSD